MAITGINMLNDTPYIHPKGRRDRKEGDEL
jgi:hypothetical protein